MDIRFIIWPRHWTMSDCEANPTFLFIFGDNMLHHGNGGQAVIRDCPNAIGILTKKAPTRGDGAYFSDKEVKYYKVLLDMNVQDIESVMSNFTNIVLPKDGWGTGLAQLDTRAPLCFRHLQSVYIRWSSQAEQFMLPKKVKLLVSGSRSIIDSTYITGKLNELVVELGGFNHVTIISGGCPTGADRVAKNFAQLNHVEYVECNAEWDKYGKSAGPRRNKTMVEECDILLAFWDETSKGTGGTISYARECSKRVVVYTLSESSSPTLVTPR